VTLRSRWAAWRERWQRWRHPPSPAGRWIEGHGFSWHGIVHFRPWVFPRRRYRLYVPRGWSKAVAAPLIVLIHGCRQTAEEFARGTRIAEAADRSGALVLMPDQKDGANPWRCWNWFDGRTAAGKGEAAIVAAMIRKTLRKYPAGSERAVVAGLSSGAALATVMGVRHPRLVRRVFSHSGLACGAASSAFIAMTVMRRGPDTDVAAIAAEARHETDGLRVAIVVVQGSTDDVVARLNAETIARQYLVLNGREVPPGGNAALPPPDKTLREAPSAERLVHTHEWHLAGQPIVRLVQVGHLAHAWSGGDGALPFNDPAPPDATTLLLEWACAP
jgi:poly(hydroxyalkanoate) depolymerase family esterase